MKRNIITFWLLFFLLALFSSCIDRQQGIPISIINDDRDCKNCQHINNQFLAISNPPANQIPFEESLDIIPLNQAITEFDSQESIIVATPVILPPPSPYDKTEWPQEYQRSPIIVPPPPAPIQPEPKPKPQNQNLNKQNQQKPTPPIDRTQKLYRVQIGAFKNKANIQRNVSLLKSAGFNPVLEKYGNLTRVVIPSVEAKNLNSIIKRLNKVGFKDTWVRNEL